MLMIRLRSFMLLLMLLFLLRVSVRVFAQLDPHVFFCLLTSLHASAL